MNIMQSYYNELTNRQLFKQYRTNLTEWNDICTSYNTGADWHAGEPILRRLRTFKAELDISAAELLNRGFNPIKVSPERPVIQQSLMERKESDEHRQNEYKQKAIQRVIDNFGIGKMYELETKKVMITGIFPQINQLEYRIVITGETGNMFIIEAANTASFNEFYQLIKK